MNLSEVKAVELVELHVRDPNTGEPMYDGETPVVIRLAGMHTDAFQQELQRQLGDDRRREKRGTAKTPAQERGDVARLYAAATRGWTGVDEPFSRSAAEALYEPEAMVWLRTQIQDALLEHAARLKK